MDALLILLLLGALVWLWASSLKAREATETRCRRICDEMRVQFLDQTVALARMMPARDANGRLVLRRWYGFEFSTDGADRRRGSACLLGQVVELVRLEMPDGPVIVNSGQLHRIQ